MKKKKTPSKVLALHDQLITVTLFRVAEDRPLGICIDGKEILQCYLVFESSILFIC